MASVTLYVRGLLLHAIYMYLSLIHSDAADEEASVDLGCLRILNT